MATNNKKLPGHLHSLPPSWHVTWCYTGHWCHWWPRDQARIRKGEKHSLTSVQIFTTFLSLFYCFTHLHLRQNTLTFTDLICPCQILVFLAKIEIVYKTHRFVLFFRCKVLFQCGQFHLCSSTGWLIKNAWLHSRTSMTVSIVMKAIVK